MPTLRTIYVQDGWRETPEHEKVQSISDSLLDPLNTAGARQLKREFDSVAKRLRSFYAAANYTNVRAVHIFGY